jgi:small-conductance mechanosensitive channel
VLEDYLSNSYDMKENKGLRARKFQTQMKFLKRILSVIILLISFALILLIFEDIQQLGATLLASAGVISIVVGFFHPANPQPINCRDPTGYNPAHTSG